MRLPIKGLWFFDVQSRFFCLTLTFHAINSTQSWTRSAKEMENSMNYFELKFQSTKNKSILSLLIYCLFQMDFNALLLSIYK